MSSKKKSSKQNISAENKKKPKNFKKRYVAIPFIIAGIICAGIIAFIVFSTSQAPLHSKIKNTSWKPAIAKNASGDEVELAEVYNVNYSSYTGSLEFKEDTFELWLSPGSPDDGTHSGSYVCVEDDRINVLYDQGTATEFKVKYNGDKVAYIVVNYSDYQVAFTQNTAE